jgi:hypothetical protein
MPARICLHCGRSVPERSALCPCRKRRASLAEVASVSVLVAVYLVAVWKLGPSLAVSSPRPAVPTPVATAGLPRAASPPEPTAAPPAAPEDTAPPSIAPAPWAETEPYDSAGGWDDRSAAPTGSSRGERRLEDALLRLSSRLDWLTQSVPRFRGSCLVPRPDAEACDRFRVEIVKTYRTLERELRDADDDARRAGVPPQAVHDSRSRHHVDEREWDDLGDLIRQLRADDEGSS